MKVGSLVQINNKFAGSDNRKIGVIIDTGVHHNGDWKYRILFFNGHEGWWTKDRLEVLCSK